MCKNVKQVFINALNEKNKKMTLQPRSSIPLQYLKLLNTADLFFFSFSLMNILFTLYELNTV